MAELARFVYVSVVALFLGLSVKELLFSTDVDAGSQVNHVHKEVPKLELTRFAGPTLEFLYCYSCGYRRAFEQYSDLIHQKYPDIAIQGDNYPPPYYRAHLAQFCGIFKFLLILVIVAGFNPFTSFGLRSPGIFTWLIENKIYACMMIFFLSNALEGQLVSTGAFEITFNGIPVWSKIETGRLPSPPELFQIVDSNLQFSTISDS